MQVRTVVCLVVAFVGYGVFLHAARAGGHGGGQGQPAAPMFPAAPAAAPTPAIPREPAVPAWGAAEYAGNGSTRYNEPFSDCSQLRIRLGNEKPTMEQEERTISKAEARVLRIRETRNGGVQVQGWGQEVYSVTACKAAVGPDGEAQRLLSQIKLSVEGGEVSVSGPAEQDDWTVFLLIRTPKAADIELSTHNGPVSLHGVDGKITARAINGPITVKDCSGEGDIAAVNGPISFSGTNGKLRLHTENGPISVALDRASWNGAGLVADAVNGPLTLRLPSGFQSSFLVESNGYTPVSCQASICSEARRTWDDQHRRIEYGSGAPVIRLSTQNGPISVL
jgi:hypothetical protein